jgi:hypothetical protein
MDDTRLIHILLDNIDYDEYKLGDDIKKWIYTFINDYTEIFVQLDTDLHAIKEDRKIELANIPTIIKIIADTYYSKYCKDKYFNENNLYIFIKYTIVVILDTDLLILSTNTNRENFINIVDSSMDLLNMNFIIDKNLGNNNTCINKNNTKYCKCLFDSVKNLFIK